MKKLFTITYKKILPLLLVILLLSPLGILSVMPKKAQASAGNCLGSWGAGLLQNTADHSAALTSVPVNIISNVTSQGTQTGSTWAQFTQDCIEHGLALALGKLILSEMTAQIVNWIDNGFDGNPAFVTNPGQFFTNIADGLAGEFILGTDLAFLCSPFKFQIQLALALNYSYKSAGSGLRFRCTLTDIIKNIDGFMNDFDKGGWPAWVSMTQNPQNNPYGAYLQADAALSARIAGQQAIEQQKLNWGNGFLSWDTCTNQDGSSYTQYGGGLTVDGTRKAQDEGAFFGNGNKCTTKTPGSVIAGTLQNQLNIPAQQLGLADDLDKIANALMNQLIKQVMGGVGGLLGAGTKGSSGRSVVDQLRDQASSDADQAITDANGNIRKTWDDSNNQSGGGGTVGAGNKPETVNIALNADVSSSSNGEDSSAIKLTDGDKVGGGTGYNNAAQTRDENNPWFMIDLGKDYYINKVNVYHSVHPNRNSKDGMKYVVQLYPSDKAKVNPQPTWQSPEQLQDFNKDYMGVVSKDNMPVKARYVRIQGTVAGVLEAAEVEVYHRNPPVITLKKGNTMTVDRNSTFVDPLFTATDETDGSLTDKVSYTQNAVDTSKAGVYIIEYSVKNSSNLVTTVSREVTVQ